MQNQRENFQLDVYASNLVFSAQNLLKMITELKHSVLVNDLETLNETVEEQCRQYRAQAQSVHPLLQELTKEVTQALFELEAEYYSSAYKAPPTA